MVTAENNWWGAASGPHDASRSVEVPPCTTAPAVELNADGTGNEVSGNADYCPWLSESYNIFDTDIDGVADYIDNCFDMPNGEDLGMCVKVIGGVFVSTGEACGGPGDCQFDKGEICQMAQQDTNDNGIGDACECYADISGPAGARDSRVDAFDLLKMKQEFNRTDCMPETCQADLNGDGKVDSFDLLIMKVQFNKTGCPVP